MKLYMKKVIILTKNVGDLVWFWWV